ncbi:CYTH domain-containing protein [Heyndrickxia sporothermodurans]|uniref:CYTH domain-containing protein n=1 Tax=Heyndrickxia sporothermodurans TaxID=46224 RepID=UPI000D3A4689|nr:CYTH domain-containing protein [Heyndrickxia sporothermodurans]MED3651581.1 CYTH domain-containing protein [Heyndrickxia sporothermodurans]MED3696945.1 CYTH domain-containing protein [Heyndrickxia sporothermodurans]MED3781985.1 CYTH domain-containing protein [Heyndrickxia sporothermodurans]PTY78313.1 CYTH domain-containing protein [Heyndrickxia sporothermodurans]
MGSVIEIELKNIVTKDEFIRIKNEFSIKDNDFTKQINHYFDSPTFKLKQIGCALRIRKKKNQFELTLKQPAEIGLLETNEIINEQQANQMITYGELPEGEVKNKLLQTNFPLHSIRYFGSLTTNRAEINYLDGLLVFDCSSYLNKNDYEIEYEVNDRIIGEKNFQELMNRLNIPIRETENKIVRFYKAKEQCLSEEK